MIKNKIHRENRIEIDLTGPQGNAYFLLGTAIRLGRQIGWTQKEIDELQNKMMLSDYEHLVDVFDESFGSFVILYR